jgi:hypothetical protein
MLQPWRHLSAVDPFPGQRRRGSGWPPIRSSHEETRRNLKRMDTSILLFTEVGFKKKKKE